MFSQDVFAYGSKTKQGIHLVDSDLPKAQKTLASFAVVSLMEAFGSSLLLLSLKLGVKLERSDFKVQRSDHSLMYETFRRQVQANQTRLDLILRANRYDVALHAWARQRLCNELRLTGLDDHPLVQFDLAKAGYSCGWVD